MKPTSQRFTGLMTLCILMSFGLFAQVGVNTTSPLATLHTVENTSTTGPFFSEITDAASNWTGVEGYNPNGSGGGGMLATGYFGILGQGAFGVYGYGFSAIYGEPVNVALDWAGYFAGDINVDNDIYYSGSLIPISDGRVKQNIRSIDGALAIVNQLRPVVYDKLVDRKDVDINIKSLNEIKPTGVSPAVRKSNEYGLIAQEVELVLPELVKEKAVKLENSDMTSLKGVDYVGLVPVLLKAIQEQQAIIDAQQQRIARLEDKIGLSEN